MHVPHVQIVHWLCRLVQILQLSQRDTAISVYYHPNSFSSTQSIRSTLANCWRFTVALDTPEVRSHLPAQQDTLIAP